MVFVGLLFGAMQEIGKKEKKNPMWKCRNKRKQMRQLWLTYYAKNYGEKWKGYF